MINIHADTQGLERAIKLLAHMPGAIDKANKAALSRTLQFMKTQAAKLGTEKYHAKSGDIKRTITTKIGSNYAQMISRDPRRSLADYYLTPRKPPRNKSRFYSLRAAVKRDGIKNLSHAFIIPLGKYHTKYYPYIRVGKGRWDIKHLRSPSIAQIIGNEEIIDRLTGEALLKFEARFNHEVLRRLGYE